MLFSLYSCVCPKRNSSGPKLDLQGVSWGQKFHTTQNSCDMPKVRQMLTKSLNNWSYSWAGFTHNTFKCCCLEWDEMEWQILGFNHVCFKEVHSNLSTNLISHVCWRGNPGITVPVFKICISNTPSKELTSNVEKTCMYM